MLPLSAWLTLKTASIKQHRHNLSQLVVLGWNAKKFFTWAHLILGIGLDVENCSWWRSELEKKRWRSNAEVAEGVVESDSGYSDKGGNIKQIFTGFSENRLNYKVERAHEDWENGWWNKKFQKWREVSWRDTVITIGRCRRSPIEEVWVKRYWVWSYCCGKTGWAVSSMSLLQIEVLV